MAGLQRSDRAIWTSDCLPTCKIRIQSKAARSIPTSRGCRLVILSWVGVVVYASGHVFPSPDGRHPPVLNGITGFPQARARPTT
jgi:hypothetical protein